MDDDARATAILTSSVLSHFASEFMGLNTVSLTCGLTFVRVINHPGMLCICSWIVRRMNFATVTLLLISSTRRVLLSNANSTLFALLFVVLARVVRLCALSWSFSASTSSYLCSGRSLSPAVLSCLYVVVSPFQRCYLSFVLRRLAYVALDCLRFLPCLLPMALRRCLFHRHLCGPLLRHLPTPLGKG
jgi:hypothetical protein